jgi:hypothetical protein
MGAGAAPKKWSLFKATFLKQKQVLGALIRHFFTIWDNKSGEVKKTLKGVYIG